MPAQHGLGPDQEEVASPVPVEAADAEPEELVPGAEAGTVLTTEGDLELLAEEKVLEEEALVAPEGADERGEEKTEEFDHPGRMADRHHLLGGWRSTFAALHGSLRSTAAPTPHAGRHAEREELIVRMAQENPR